MGRDATECFVFLLYASPDPLATKFMTFLLMNSRRYLDTYLSRYSSPHFTNQRSQRGNETERKKGTRKEGFFGFLFRPNGIKEIDTHGVSLARITAICVVCAWLWRRKSLLYIARKKERKEGRIFFLFLDVVWLIVIGTFSLLFLIFGFRCKGSRYRTYERLHTPCFLVFFLM